jgi:hypothetical protein
MARRATGACSCANARAGQRDKAPVVTSAAAEDVKNWRLFMGSFNPVADQKARRLWRVIPYSVKVLACRKISQAALSYAL